MYQQEDIGFTGPLNIRVVEIQTVSEMGTMTATVLVPLVHTHTTPLVALHGISRNHDCMLQEFMTGASSHGRLIILPRFTHKEWPVFQRINRRIRPDKALLELFRTLRVAGLLTESRIDLFGYSGGAQLAHRFAMLYPEMVHKLHMGAAGWYTLPDTDTPYPLGLGPANNGDSRWGRRMSSGLHDYLALPITLYVGREDTHQDKVLRSSPDLNAVQGSNRLERARNYIAALREMQARAGLPSRAKLVVIDGCGHSFERCNQKGNLVARVCA